MSDTNIVKCPDCGQPMRGTDWLNKLERENARLLKICHILSTELIEACNRDDFMPDEAAEALSEARVLLAKPEAKP